MLRRILLALLIALAVAPEALAQAGYLQFGTVSPTNPTLTAGSNQPMSLDTSGGLRMTCIAGCTSGAGFGFNNADGVTPVGSGLGQSQVFLYGYHGAVWNRLQLDASNNLNINCVAGCNASSDPANGPVTPGAVATNSKLAGAQFNTALPTLTTGQQAALQADSSGRLITVCAVGCSSATDPANGPVTPGAAGTNSKLVGGIFNTALPTVGNGQQVAIQLDASGRQLVTVGAPIVAGASVIGQVGGVTVPVTVTPTVTVASYSLGQCVGGKMTFANAARTSGTGFTAPGSGLVQSAVITDTSGQNSSIDVVVFNSDPTSSTFTDHAACSVNNADVPKIAGVIHVTDCSLLGASSPGECQATGLALPYSLGAGNTSAFAVAIARGTPTFTATNNVGVRLGFLPD